MQIAAMMNATHGATRSKSGIAKAAASRSTNTILLARRKLLASSGEIVEGGGSVSDKLLPLQGWLDGDDFAWNGNTIRAPSDPPDVIRSARRLDAPIFPRAQLRMKQNTYDFRQFQEELAALDRKSDTQSAPDPAAAKMGTEDRLAQAKAEFMALRKRYRLTVAHVIAFFPEEEGVAYLQELIAGQEGKSRRKVKSATAQEP